MSEDTAKDIVLVQCVLNGERNAYRTLVDRHSPMVFHIVRRFVKNEDLVKELAQQVFVKCYERLDSFNGNSKFSSWLYQMTMNHCRDYAKNIRRQNVQFSEMEKSYLDQHMMNNQTPLTDVEDQEWNVLLYQALDQLPPDYAEPFLLKYRDGLTYPVMSEKLDVSVSALKVRVHRARKELKEIMENLS